MDALKLLNYECWREVFHNLNAEDLVSCRQVCKTFHNLLDESSFQQKWKFHLVLPLLYDYLQSVNSRGKVVSRKGLYNVRLVSKSWRHSIDMYASERYEPTPIFLQRKIMDIPLATWFKVPRQIEQFQQKFGESNANPFPARTMRIEVPMKDPEYKERLRFDDDFDDVFDYYYDDEDYINPEQVLSQIAYLEKIGDLVEQFGRHILKLELNFESGYVAGPLALCKLLKRITIRLPNLKTLIIGWHGVYNNDDLTEMTTYIGANVLAELPKLQVLVTDRLQTTVENYLLDKYAPQLTHFERRSPKTLLKQEHIQGLKNLRKLSLHLQDSRDTLEVLRFLDSPLKVLKFTLWHPELRRWQLKWNWNLEKVLRNLKHLQVECLKIRGFSNMNVAEFLWLKQCINESVQTLSFHYTYCNNGKISFNFLEVFPNLKKLELKCTSLVGQVPSTHPRTVPEVVKLNEYMKGADMPYYSNVWEKLPLLMRLTVIRNKEPRDPNQRDVQYTRSTYTRDKYESVRRMLNSEFVEEIAEDTDWI